MPAPPPVTMLPDEYVTHLDNLSKLVAQMSRAIVAAFEMSDPLSIGGTTGIYILQNPFGTPCEYSIVCLSAFAAANASAVISTQNNLIQLADNTLFGVGAAQSNQPSTGFAGVVMMAAPGTSTPGPENWFPLGNSENVSMQLTVTASHSAILTLQFRRRKTPSGVVSF
jgi:hypothetical protein